MYSVTLQNPDGEVTFECDGDSLMMDVAEEEGIEMPYSCRSGSCSTCAGIIVEGTVDQSEGSFLEDEQMEKMEADPKLHLQAKRFTEHMEKLGGQKRSVFVGCFEALCCFVCMNNQWLEAQDAATKQRTSACDVVDAREAYGELPGGAVTIV